MEVADRVSTSASELLEQARRFQSAAAEPGSHSDAPDALASLEEALRVLSAAWYQLAADGAPSPPPSDGLSREQEVHLMGRLHDVAATFARGARVCREARSEVTPIVARRAAAALG
jgi:hypothetical protein